MGPDEDSQYVADWIARFNHALSAGDGERVARLFHDDGYWRSSLSLAWRIETAHGPLAIENMLAQATNPMPTLSVDGPIIRGSLAGLGETVECLIAWRSDAMTGRGYLRLQALSAVGGQAGGEGVAMTLLTASEALNGIDELSLRNRDVQSWSPADHTWTDERVRERSFDDRDPEVLIVGAGHAGLALAARLRHIGVDTLVLESKPRIGDTWRERYRTLRLHNEISGNHLPYLPFPAGWPKFIPKDKLANWLEFYCEALELNVWTGARFEHGDFDEDADKWTVTIQLATGDSRTLRPRRLVLATGLSGKPKRLDLPGADDFLGTIMHSGDYDGTMEVAGKNVVVLGTGTSAHDIAEDVHRRGGHATMLQRSPTTVVSVEQSARAYELHRVWEGKRPTEDTDLSAASIPYDLLRRLHVPLNASMVEADRDLIERLERRGFLVDKSTSFFVKLLTRLGGYYLDVGASELIANGAIAVRSSAGIERLHRDHVQLMDGTRLPADLLVLSTGYTSFTSVIAELLGSETAQRVGEVWGLDETGELRNMWTGTAQRGLYIAGGPLTMCRFYSRSLALRLKAELDGLVGADNVERESVEAAVG
jgi:putative flavoprotein involved in K+ transport